MIQEVRIQRAREALKATSKGTLDLNKIHQEDLTDAVVDLITNLLHYCDRKKIDAELVLRRASYHLQAERKENKHAKVRVDWS